MPFVYAVRKNRFVPVREFHELAEVADIIDVRMVKYTSACGGLEDTYLFDLTLPRHRLYKLFDSASRRGNNWKRMHGEKLYRVPLRERRKHKRLNIPQ